MWHRLCWRRLLLAMLLLIVLAALQAGLVEFSALASTRPCRWRCSMHPQLQWMLPLLPLAGRGPGGPAAGAADAGCAAGDALWPRRCDGIRG
jgi:hypothetical protein